MSRRDGLDLSNGNGRENECSQESYDEEGAHGGAVWRGDMRASMTPCGGHGLGATRNCEETAACLLRVWRGGDEKVGDYLLGLVGLGELREGGMISLSLFAYAKMPCTNDSKFKNEVHRRILLTLNSLAIFSL